MTKTLTELRPLNSLQRDGFVLAYGKYSAGPIVLRYYEENDKAGTECKWCAFPNNIPIMDESYWLAIPIASSTNAFDRGDLVEKPRTEPAGGAALGDVEKRVHDLKIWPAFFDDVESGCKSFEYRRNDRDYRVGDVLRLREWDPETEHYTGRETTKAVTYVLTGGQTFPLPDGYAILGLALINSRAQSAPVDAMSNARKLYEAHTDNDAHIHSNRFLTWDELPEAEKKNWMLKFKSGDGR